MGKSRSVPGWLRHGILRKAGPGTRVFAIARRWWIGIYHDGFIHAGNFAYMALISLFPFFIAVAAIVSLIGDQGQREAAIDAVMAHLPPSVGETLGPVARDAVGARKGWLLWVGGAIGLWTASSLIETIRDVLHRSYGTTATRPFWAYRIGSIGLIFASVILMLLAFGAQVTISAVQQFLYSYFPGLDGIFSGLVYSHAVSALVVFLSVWMLFRSLAPSACQGPECPMWPGALLISVWWVLLIALLPDALRLFFSYDLTYGSLAGVMIALFFFWLVGLGVVFGAALNAALADVPGGLEAVAPTGTDAATGGDPD